MNAIPRAVLVLLAAGLLGAAPAVRGPLPEPASLKAITVYPNPIVLTGPAPSSAWACWRNMPAASNAT